MIQELIHDTVFLAGKSKEATIEDAEIAQDLLDTLKAHKETCVGMAANMIGKKKRIIAFLDEDNITSAYTVMFNPEIVVSAAPYETEEGCLSYLGGPVKCRRYGSVKVKFQTLEMKTKYKTYTDFTAQIIQHEIDHLNGILI